MARGEVTGASGDTRACTRCSSAAILVAVEERAAVVMTTVSSGTDADALAEALVEAGWAACVQQVPIVSTYRWEGSVTTDGEVLMLIKTPGDRVGAVVAHLEANHPFEVPEILVVADVEASAPYLAWMVAETRG